MSSFSASSINSYIHSLSNKTEFKHLIHAIRLMAEEIEKQKKEIERLQDDIEAINQK